MSRSKANAKAKVISSRHRRTVYIAKIIVERDQVHHVCTLHKRLGLGKVPRHWRDDEEYVFVHRIPLSCIVEVVQWTGKALPRKENYIWKNPAKTQRPAEQPPSPVLSYSAISGDLWDDPYNEQEKCEESLNHWEAKRFPSSHPREPGYMQRLLFLWLHVDHPALPNYLSFLLFGPIKSVAIARSLSEPPIYVFNYLLDESEPSALQGTFGLSTSVTKTLSSSLNDNSKRVPTIIQINK
ncbi:hypothetical protein LENED_008328 [Lentinula edodes]|uniref:Uncharacterized protein n=1 Tax=Lentinula edodes TaxID=5353 RepID=A0A1Q3EGT6_LENED|nr:hypothetical protein LENED_008328 [Lentinula edodes]